MGLSRSRARSPSSRKPSVPVTSRAAARVVFAGRNGRQIRDSPAASPTQSDLRANTDQPWNGTLKINWQPFAGYSFRMVSCAEHATIAETRPPPNLDPTWNAKHARIYDQPKPSTVINRKLQPETCTRQLQLLLLSAAPLVLATATCRPRLCSLHYPECHDAAIRWLRGYSL